MQRILGIDPGSRITGYGVIDTDGFRHHHVASGHLPIKGNDLPERLGVIFSKIDELTAQKEKDVLEV